MEKKQVNVSKFPIRLGQFLKLANVVADGLEAKLRIANEEILINGTVDTRRGRQLKPGDRVTVDDVTYICTQTVK